MFTSPSWYPQKHIFRSRSFMSMMFYGCLWVYGFFRLKGSTVVSKHESLKCGFVWKSGHLQLRCLFQFSIIFPKGDRWYIVHWKRHPCGVVKHKQKPFKKQQNNIFRWTFEDMGILRVKVQSFDFQTSRPCSQRCRKYWTGTSLGRFSCHPAAHERTSGLERTLGQQIGSVFSVSPKKNRQVPRPQS